MEEETKSEFGKGFIYNLVLFAKHYDRFMKYMERNNELADKYPDLWKKGEDDEWFNAAGDHFFELEIPEQFKETTIGKLATRLQDEAIKRRHCKTTPEEFEKFFKSLEDLCLMIDKELGVDTIRATRN